MQFPSMPLWLGPLVFLGVAAFGPLDQPKYQAEEITLETPTGVIHGTLLLPERLPAPLALIIAGSGPTDRDGNSRMLPGKNNSLKYLAEGLAKQGIASVRFDKRAIGQSKDAAVSESDLRFDTYVIDAAAWLAKLRKDRRFSTITVVGHSEGSLIGMMAAAREPANAFVSIAGAGRSAGVVLREQLKAGLPAGPLYDEAMRILTELEKGRMVDSISPPLAPMFRPSVQPYVISWLPLDPATLLAKLNLPVLLLQGTTDLQISVADAELLARAQPRARLVIVEGMNHVLKEAPPDRLQQGAAYSDPALPVVPRVIDEIARFVQTLRS
ncbi:MAG TPA: alpha/beta fold hydrolase [Longimicrobiales bacterium]|nr:alpha/beta fold hydrolase [Longimicrobiales bacterium]